MLIQENVPLAPFTTLGVGGPARYFARARGVSDILDALEFSDLRHVPIFVLGGGSNLVIADRGFPGLVIKIEIRGVTSQADGEFCVFEAGSGEDWDTFVAHTVDQNCAGLECLSGIPGTVGGTPVQNVGAYGQDVSQTIRSVVAIEIRTGEIRVFSNPECGFAYRSSIFNDGSRDRYILTSVSYRLHTGGAPSISYRDLQLHFAGRDNPTLVDTRNAVREIRLSKAMLIVPGDDDARSAGSFFKNPVVDCKAAEFIAHIADQRGLPLPTYAAADGMVKLPAAWLVEQSGFGKGFCAGAVGISRRHSLAIVNRGGATAEEIIALKNRIQQAVFDQFGIELKPEPVFVGFER